VNAPPPVARSNRPLIIGIVAALAVVVVLLVGGVVWVIFQIADQLGAPGIAGATGTGACSSAEAVSITMVFADGHSVQACTRDMPACPNQTITVNGQVEAGSSHFALETQLRSTGRRYILFMESDVPIASNMPEHVLQIDESSFMAKGPGGPGPVTGSSPGHALVDITLRDPTESFLNGQASGAVTVSASAGVVRGTVDESYANEFRTDRPIPSGPVGPVKVVGTFSCKQ
jgi:hypothetical protein